MLQSAPSRSVAFIPDLSACKLAVGLAIEDDGLAANRARKRRVIDLVVPAGGIPEVTKEHGRFPSIRLFHNMKQSFILTSPRFYLQCSQRQANSPPPRNVGKELLCQGPRAFESSIASGAMSRAPASRCRRRFGSFCTSASAVPRRASPSLPTNLV